MYKDFSFLTSHTPHPSLLKNFFGGKRDAKLKIKNFSQQEERGEIEELFGEELAAGRYGRGARV